MARLDRLLTAKGVAQLCATLGRQFSFEQLQAVSRLDDATLQGELSRLVEAEFLYQRGLPPQATYLFKHALIQEAAYQSLLKRTRQQYHQQIAQALEKRFPETREHQPELLAHHYTEAGLREEAIGYWQRASRRAIERSAHVEATGHLTKALDLLKAQPATPDRIQQEILLQTTLGSTLMATKGYAAPEVEQAYARARELCQQVGETPELFRVLVGLHMVYRQQAELQTSYEVAKQLLVLAENIQTPEFLVAAHQALGTALYFLGEFPQARTHLEQGVALYEPRQHDSYAILYGQDPGVICLSTLARTLWALGFPDQALQRSHEALALAQQLFHPFSQTFALYFGSVVHQYRREWWEVQKLTEVLMALSTQQGFVQRLAQGRIMLGWALVEQGQVAEGIAQMRHSVAAYGATGADLGRSSYLALLAEAYGKAGQIEEGVAVLAGAPIAVQEHRICFNEAEIHRLKGELLLRLAMGESDSPVGPTTEAEACFRQALDVARRQQAKSLELRAVMSLSRLWQRQCKRDEARQLLAPIYEWFAEGFDTADLREAQALLEELS